MSRLPITCLACLSLQIHQNMDVNIWTPSDNTRLRARSILWGQFPSEFWHEGSRSQSALRASRTYLSTKPWTPPNPFAGKACQHRLMPNVDLSTKEYSGS